MKSKFLAFAIVISMPAFSMEAPAQDREKSLRYNSNYSLPSKNRTRVVGQGEIAALDRNCPDYDYLLTGPLCPCTAIIFKLGDLIVMLHMDDGTDLSKVKKIFDDMAHNFSIPLTENLNVFMYSFELDEERFKNEFSSLYKKANQKRVLETTKATIAKLFNVNSADIEYVLLKNPALIAHGEGENLELDAHLTIGVNKQGEIFNSSVIPNDLLEIGQASADTIMTNLEGRWNELMIARCLACRNSFLGKGFVFVSIHDVSSSSVVENTKIVVKSNHEYRYIPCANIMCRKTGELKCSRCKKAFYCSTGCQKNHWHNGHKFACKKK